jgi:hypothetical protein
MRPRGDPLVRLCKPRSIPMRARVVPCLLQLATVDLTLRHYDTDDRRSDEHRGCEEACAQRTTEAARFVQRGRQSRRMICSVDPVGHIVGPDVDA